MKRTAFLLIVCLSSFLIVNAQKESGTVYSEHEAIEKTRAMWAAFVKGDKETFKSFLTDTVNYYINGISDKIPKENIARNIDFWQTVTNLAIEDDIPVYPDVIQYKEGDLWVLDWLRVTGIHKESGINFDTPMHDIYGFNKEGKISTWAQYVDMDVMDEINNSKHTIENGIVYVNHPYIVTVRKLINAYCAEDIATMRSLYHSNAMFSKLSDKINRFINLEDKMKEDKETFDSFDNIKLTQVGYPDCIYYTKDDNYVVYSWWKLSCTTVEGKNLSEIPVMLTNTFDKDGKITWQALYVSDNHFR